MEGKIARDHWHPGFLGAMEIEFLQYKENLIFDGEHELSKEPLKMDLLIITKDKDTVIENQIGEIFRRHNVFEYKSPEDGLTIDDYYKTVGYAYLYKGLGKTVNEIPASELTVTLVRDTKPVAFFKEAESTGATIEEKYPGIYRINGLVNIPTQFVLTKNLDRKLHTSLRLLTKHLTEEDAASFIEMASKFTEQGDRHNADALLQVSVSANREVFENVKRRDPLMCQAMKELMKDEIMEERQEERQDERKRVATDMLKAGEPLEKITLYSRLSETVIRSLAKSIGVVLL